MTHDAQQPLAPGRTATASVTVTRAHTADAVGSGSLAVYATPMLAALMERAACLALAQALAPGQTSVGTQLTLRHTAASPVGARVTATATLTAIEGRRLTFALTAADESGEIGRAEHTRVLVDAERFMEKLAARQA